MEKNKIIIPKKVLEKLEQFGYTKLPEVNNLVVEYIKETEREEVDWYYFTNWVAMFNSDH